MTIQTRLVTAEELLRKPDDGFRYELVSGELRKMPPAEDEHGYVAMEIGCLLGNHVKANNLGRTYAAETGFRIFSNPDTVRTPDAAFVGREHLKEIGLVRGYRPGAPDLAVEVVSSNAPTPRSRRRPSRGSKRAATWCWSQIRSGAP